MDADSPWEEDPVVDHIPEAEWTKITSEFTNVGYREGILAGKEAWLQAGFDAGFADAGVPLGRELGQLRGTAAAMKSFLASQKPGAPELETLGHISSMLSTIRVSDIAPRDPMAEQHAEAHGGPAGVEHTPSDAGTGRRTLEDVAKLKERLSLLSAKLGLPVLP